MDDKEFLIALTKAQQFQKSYGKADDIPDEMLPETHDVRNINGFDFTGAVRN